jgi:opacity protein-like surface antigen
MFHVHPLHGKRIMKKTAIAAALALSLGASLAHAQTSDPRGWYAGIDVGASRSNRSGLDDDTDVSLGIYGGSDDANSGVFGLGAYYELNRQWFLKAGWDHYTKVGGSQTGEDSLNTYSLGVGYRF